MSIISYYGYDDATCLQNETVRVVLTGHGGGRVLECALGLRGVRAPPVFGGGGGVDAPG
jgi:hypothetical protein